MKTPPPQLLELQEIAKTRRLQVGILIFDKVEVLDFCGPFETLSVCRLDPTADDNFTESPFHVELIAAAPETKTTKDPITTVGGMQVLPHSSIDDFDQHKEKNLDILILPGGFGARAARSNPKILEFVRDQAFKVKILASVCTGTMLLAESGVLEKGSMITTHWQLLDVLQDWYPEFQVVKDRSVIRLLPEEEQGKSRRRDEKQGRPIVYTSAGISAGIDMCFWIIKDLFGDDISRAAAKHMEYSYPEDFSRRIDL